MRSGPWVIAYRWTDVAESLRQKILKLNKTFLISAVSLKASAS